MTTFESYAYSSGRGPGHDRIAMTLTIKDSPEVTGSSKSASTGQVSENTANQSPRTNPVCLEVPVLVRSLPGNAPGAADPTREEARSVIVFDNGCVLRMANPLPPGQTVILSNQQGRDVVCRVVGGRNLSPVKGYIEVEFIEPVSDFWRIHQNLDATRVPTPEPAEPPASSVVAPPEPSQAVQLAEPPAPSRSAIPVKDQNPFPGGAPGYDDIAGLVEMAPRIESPVKKSEPAVRPSVSRSMDRPEQIPGETSTVNSTSIPVSSVSELISEKPAAPPTQAVFSPPARKQSVPNDFTGRSVQVSVPSSFTSSSSGESRSRMPLLLGGAAFVIAGFGAGYFLMHRGTSPDAAPPVSMASQPSATPDEASGGPETAPASQPPVEQAQPKAAEPVSAAVSAPAEVAPPAPSATPNVRQRANPAEEKQPERTTDRHQTIPSLKMTSPKIPGKKLPEIPDGSSIASVNMASTAAPVGATPGSFGSRTENQPAPPPAPLAAISAPASVQTVQEAKLISSTRPVYPAMARASNIQGHVVIMANINEKGQVIAAKAVSGPVLLRQAAVDAVRQWKYSPALTNGKPAASQVNVGLDFRLN
jgi:periplasmic protein TonB